MQKTKVSEKVEANGLCCADEVALCFDVLNLFTLRVPPPPPHKAPKQTTSSPQRHPRLPPHRKHLHTLTGLVAILISSLESPISVSEILDSELLGEGLIPSQQHVHDILLVESPEMVSYRATTYGQLVESTFLWKLHDLRSNKAEVSDGIRLVLTGFEDVLGVKPQQYAFHCDAIADEVTLLLEPFKIFELDFSKRPQSRGETELSIKATNEGRVHAVISWWILQLDREWTIFYSTAPRWINLPANISSI